MTVIKFPELRDFLEQDTRRNLLDSVVDEARFFASTYRDFRPEVDIVENEETYQLHAALPGLSKDEIKVEIEGNRLIIRGERKAMEDTNKFNFHRREIKRGNFARSFYLPENVNTGSIDAVYKDGMLQVILKKEKTANLVTNVKVK